LGEFRGKKEAQRWIQDCAGFALRPEPVPTKKRGGEENSSALNLGPVTG